MLPAIQYVLVVLFPLAVAYGAASDLLSMTIPNRLSLALVAGFVLLAPLTGMGWQTFALHWLAGTAVLAACFSMFALGVLGGGDAKFAAAIALWLGLGHTVEFVITTAVLGGLLVFAVLAFRRSALPLVAVRQPWLERLHDGKTGVPYGIALAGAALAIYPNTIWMSLMAP